MKKGILERELKKIASIRKEFGAKKVILFGSRLEDIQFYKSVLSKGQVIYEEGV